MTAKPVQNDTRTHILSAARPVIGQKGFSAVGLSEILGVAKVPKGSFYHYFASKEAFGEALLEQYFATYLMRMDALLDSSEGTAAERFMAYWEMWRDAHVTGEIQDHCLVVKLGAEVCDLSERMRVVLQKGTDCILERLSRFVSAGQAEGSLKVQGDPRSVAGGLYQLWLGATLLAKFCEGDRPFVDALRATREMLRLSD